MSQMYIRGKRIGGAIRCGYDQLQPTVTERLARAQVRS
jgi:hypothetical protein